MSAISDKGTDPTNGSSNGLATWLAGLEDTAPLDTVDRPTAAEPRSGPPEVPRELAAMRTRLLVAAGKARLQQDPAWLDVLSDQEVRADRRIAESVRSVRRKRLATSARAGANRAAREQRAADRVADLELTERVWQRRALARRARMLDPTSRLAALHRTHLITSLVLITLAVAGIGWTSFGVHDALVGPGGNPLAYVVEPLFSLPLVVIMTVQARAAQWGRVFPNERGRRKVYGLEAGLLLATVAVNTSSVLPGLGRWQGTTMLLAHLAPPLLILVAVTLQPMVAGFIAEILTTAHLDATEGEKRLSAETVDVLALARRVRDDWTAGELRAGPDGGPSISHVQSRFGIAKQRAQAAVDAWRQLFG